MINFLDRYGEMLAKAIATHLFYVIASVSIALVVALALGIALSRVPKYSNIIIPVISIFQTVPGIVFIGVLFIYLGMVPKTVIIALTVYAIFPILKNTYTGLIEVPDEYIEAARGCGMTEFQILTKVELPLASPTIVSGIRMSTIYTVSWAVLAAMIGLGGLGEFIYRGVGTNNNSLILGGAIPSAILAILIGYIIDKLQDKFTPRGLKEGEK